MELTPPQEGEVLQASSVKRKGISGSCAVHNMGYLHFRDTGWFSGQKQTPFQLAQ